VLQLYDEGGYCSIDTRSVYQSTLLHTAAKHGHVELARALLQRGAQVNLLDYGGMRRSPLHWACHGGHVALVEVLLEADADTSVGGYVSVCDPLLLLRCYHLPAATLSASHVPSFPGL
jgi:hypothetical protein